MKHLRITTPSEHRALLIATMEAVLDGRVNVAMANSVVGLSAEVHKSIRQEWDMRVFAAENINIESGKLMKMIEADRDE